MRIDVRIFVLGLLILFLAAVCTFRWLPETPDLVRYRDSYDRLSEAQPFIDRFEPAYILSMWFAKFACGFHFQTFLFFYTATALTLKFGAFLRLTRSAILASALYVLLLYYQAEFTAMREAMAIGFAYLAIADVCDEKNLRAAFLFLVSMMFHYSIAVLAGVTAFILLASKYPMLVVAVMSMAIVVIVAQWDLFASFAISHIGGQLATEITAVAGETFETMYTPPRLAFFASVLLLPIFARPWTSRQNTLLFLLGLAGVLIAVLFAPVPVIGVRFLELFEMAPVLLALRAPIDSPRIVPAIGFGLASAWVSLPTWLYSFRVS